MIDLPRQVKELTNLIASASKFLNEVKLEKEKLGPTQTVRREKRKLETKPFQARNLRQLGRK